MPTPNHLMRLASTMLPADGQVAEHWREGVKRIVADAGSSHDGIVHISFDQLTRDPIGIVRRLTSELGHTLSQTAEDAMRAFLDLYPRGGYHRRAYDLASYGLDANEEHRRFKRYIDFVEYRCPADRVLA